MQSPRSYGHFEMRLTYEGLSVAKLRAFEKPTISHTTSPQLKNPTEGNAELVVVKIRRLEASTSLSQTRYTDNHILQEIFAVDFPDPVLHHLDLPVKITFPEQ